MCLGLKKEEPRAGKRKKPAEESVDEEDTKQGEPANGANSEA